MQFSTAVLLAVGLFDLTQATVVTEVHPVTEYQYQQINVLVDANGVPFSTQTHTQSTAQGPAASTSTISVSTQAASTASTEAPASSSHSHEAAAPNFEYVTPSASTGAATSSSSSAPAAKTTSAASGQDRAAAAPAAPFSGDGTFYEVGIGACGITNSDSDLIAALNAPQFNSFGSMSNGNPVCGRRARVHHKGKSVVVAIEDKCPGCSWGDLDLSPAAFSRLANQDAGRIHITWEFI